MTRGDSGMSDSQFMKTQDILQKKAQQFSDNFDSEVRVKQLNDRIIRKKLKQIEEEEKSKSLWQKLVEYFRK